MQVELRVKAEGKPEQKVVISKNVTIGRSKTCQFRVLSNDVSREHCQLIVSDTGLAVRDLGSSNGTQLNGKTIPAETDVQVPSGATVDIGPLKLVVKYAVAAEPIPPQAKPTTTVAKTTASKPVVEKASKPKVDATDVSAKAKPTATAKKKAQPPQPVAEPEPEFELEAVSDNDDSTSDFPIFATDESGDGSTFDAATAYKAAAARLSMPQDEIAESDGDEALGEEAAETSTELTTGPATPVETSAAIETDSDDPVFSAGDDDGPDFSFDQIDDVVTAPSSAPVSQPAPAVADTKPGKLKSLFGMFGRSKKPVEPAQASGVAAASVTVSPVVAASTSDDADAADWLSGATSESPVASDDSPDFFQAEESEPEPLAKPTPPAKAATPQVSAKPVAEKKTATKPASAPAKKAAPPQEDGIPDFNFSHQLTADDSGVDDPAFTDFLDQFGK